MNSTKSPTALVSELDWTKRFARRAAQMKRSAVREFLKVTAQPGMISFAGGLPAPELFPVEEIREAAGQIWQSHAHQALQYGEAEGLGPLRDWIANRFSTASRSVLECGSPLPLSNGPSAPNALDATEGLRADRKRQRPGAVQNLADSHKLDRRHVLITCGAQQALQLLGQIFIDADDGILLEDPTYLALLSAWRPLGARFVPIASDQDGLRTADLNDSLRHQPKLLYCVPNFQNPQGTTLSAVRRQELISWAGEHGVVLIEDNPYGDLRYEGTPLPHLFDLANAQPRRAPVIYVGTFSKILAPGLRIGWVIAPEPVIEKLVQAKQAADLHTSTLNQHLVLELLQRGLWEAQLPKLCRAYRERRDTMLDALEQFFPQGTTWTRPEGGMFLMVTLPPDQSAHQLLERALTQQVVFVPATEFYIDGTGTNRLRLNFSNPTPAQIEEGIRRLGRLLS